MAESAVAGIEAEGDIQAARARREADRAEESAESARNAAAAIPGFAGNAQAFFGLRVKDFQLVGDKGEDGDEPRAAGYGAMFVLPAAARFFMRGNELLLELPFTG